MYYIQLRLISSHFNKKKHRYINFITYGERIAIIFKYIEMWNFSYQMHNDAYGLDPLTRFSSILPFF